MLTSRNYSYCVVVFMVSIHVVSTLTCFPCKTYNEEGHLIGKRECKKLADCKGGITTSICGCCKVCAKVEKEYCGGVFGLYGVCDHGLSCVIADHAILIGTCTPLTELNETEKINKKSMIKPTPESPTLKEKFKKSIKMKSRTDEKIWMDHPQKQKLPQVRKIRFNINNPDSLMVETRRT